MAALRSAPRSERLPDQAVSVRLQALRLIGRAVDVLVVGGLTLTFKLLKTIISSLAGLVTGAIVGAFVGPGPVLGVLSQTATQGVKDKFASAPPAASSMAADVPKE